MRTQGWRGFFSGSVAAICRNVPHSALVYSFYPHFAKASKEVFSEEAEGEESFFTRFVAGYITMVCVTLVTHPLDTLRVRLSVSPSKTDLTTSARAIYRADGIRGFYMGFGATLLGAGPRGAIGFAIFETAKPVASEYLGEERQALSKFLCGYVAGVCAETVVYPLDTVRRRQQALGSQSPITGLNALAALRYIAQREGFSGLFKGIALNLIKNPAAVAVSFAVNDFVKESLGYGQNGRDDDERPPVAPEKKRDLVKKPTGDAFFGG